MKRSERKVRRDNENDARRMMTIHKKERDQLEERFDLYISLILARKSYGSGFAVSFCFFFRIDF
jgi:hypothetical protein